MRFTSRNDEAVRRPDDYRNGSTNSINVLAFTLGQEATSLAFEARPPRLVASVAEGSSNRLQEFAQTAWNNLVLAPSGDHVMVADERTGGIVATSFAEPVVALWAHRDDT